MKKIYLSILSFGFGLAVNAQTLTVANHSPIAGEMFGTYQCDSVGIGPGASGANASWNFSTLITHSSTVANFTVMTNANTSYPIPGVSVASSINNISYYKTSPTDMKYWGGNLIVGPVTGALIYTASAVSAIYPMSLNTTSSCVTGGTINTTAPLPQSGTFTGNSSATADGTGTLTLPTGVFNNVVRVVTSQTINFTVPVATGTVTQQNFDYYDVGKKESLFTISTSTVITSLSPTASTQTIVSRSFPSTVGIKENKQNLIEMTVYPNPSTTHVNFTTESKDVKYISVYDISGKLVEKQNFTNNALKLDVSAYTNGIYLYSVMGNNNQTLKTGKLTVSH